MAEDNAINRITDTYYKLTTSEKKLADFVVANGAKAQLLSISDMAGECDVAEATISRFCRKLGYPSFSAFKLALAIASERQAMSHLKGEVGPNDSISDMCMKVASDNIEAITETQALIDPEVISAAADAILASDKIICMGQGGSMLMAREVAHLFSTTFSGFFPMVDSHMQAIVASQLTKNDMIMYFSYSGSTKELLDLLRIAQKNGVKTLIVTRYPNSPGAAMADLVLQCGSTESPLQLGSVPARVAQLYLMDVLFAEVCRRDIERCRKNRERVADALVDKHI